MKLVPLNERIVVRRESSEKISAGGIVIPDSAQKQSQRGEVIAVWHSYEDDDGKRHRPSLRKGDRVLFPKYSGEEFDMDGSKVLLLKETDLLGLIDESDEPAKVPGPPPPGALHFKS